MIARAIALGALLGVVSRSAVAAQTCAGCTSDDTLPRAHILPAIGVHVGAPQKVSLGLGVVLGEDWQRDGHDHSRNVALFVEPGISAGRVSVAYLEHGYGSFGSGFGIAATALRTWDDPWVAKENITYVGGELFLWPILLAGPRVGLFHSVTGTPRSDRWFFSFGLGIGI